MQFCPNCGAKNTPTAKFCAQCGHAVASLPAPAPVMPPPPMPPAPAVSVPQPGPLPAQTKLRGRYQIIRLLGQGGMGAVYLAQDQNAFNRRCVVKEMLTYYNNPAEQQKAEKDFEREARVLATLRYDGVPQVYEYFIESGKYYLVMEFVEGKNLEDRLGLLGGRLPMDEALTYGLQLANILVHLAKQTPPVIHRDIKPANIILDQDQNKVKLVDFGLAKESAAAGLTGTLSAPLGTPGYAPMEQYTNQVESRTDIYALGATLHHLLTGRDPRTESSFDFPPVRTFLPGVKPEVEELVARMVAMKVADRPSASETRDLLEALIRPLASSASSGAMPFTFRSGPVAYAADDLALICDQHWEDGIHHLYAGHFEAWLDTISRHDLAVRAESIRVRGGNQAAGLEEFLRAANPTIPLPSLAVDTRVLDLGVIEKGSVLNTHVQVKNVGRGCLYGRIVPKCSWATIKPQDFSLMPNQVVELVVAITTITLAEGDLDQPAFEITSNGGQELIGIHMTITWQPVLVIEPKRRLNLGDMLQDQLQAVTAPLILRNTGGGVLQGHLATDASWLSFDAVDFTIPSGGAVTIQVTALLDDPTLQITSTVIRVELPSGSQELTASVGVRRLSFDQRTRTRTWAGYGALMALGYAGQILPWGYLVLHLLGNQLTGWLPWVGLAGLFVASLAAFHVSRRWVAQLDEMETYYFGQDLKATLLVSCFSVRKVAMLAGAGALVGGVAGWRFAWQAPEQTWFWVLVGLLSGGLGGALLGGEGAPSPLLPASQPWMARFWRGLTLDASPTAAALRCGGLVVSGALLAGLISGSGSPGPDAAVTLAGAGLGLLLAAESQRILALRLRWFLELARVGLMVSLGAFLAVTLLFLLRTGNSWHLLLNYGSITLAFPGFGPVIWLLFCIAIGWLGALGGLWAVDNLQLVRPQAWRLFGGLTGLLLLASFPVYLFSALILGLFLPYIFVNVIVLLLTAVTVGVVGWALFFRRTHVETALQFAGQAFSAGVNQSRTLSQSAQGRLQQRIQTTGSVQMPGWLAATGAKAKGVLMKVKLPPRLTASVSGLSAPSLHEIEDKTPLPLAIAAILTALLLQTLTTRLAVEVAVGLGLVFVALLLVVALLVGGWFFVLSMRQRHP